LDKNGQISFQEFLKAAEKNKAILNCAQVDINRLLAAA
jgi:hypothetical protein